MTNQYVPDLSQLGAGDIARSTDVNSRYENTIAGFDRLPEPKVGEQGFSAAVPVGEPVNADHAATKNFVETGVTSQVVIAEGHKDAAALSEAAALASENAASSSEGIALAQAGIATTKAGEASVSAAAALASEDAAALSEAAALASEGAALASKNAASASEIAADADRVLAQAARVGAELAYDSFDDRYLGPKASDPTVDNDGNALLTGALYFDTNNNQMKAYTGSIWLVAFIPPESLDLQQVTLNGATTNQAVTFSNALSATNASVNLTALGTTTSTTNPVLMITAEGLVEKKTLGSNAFNSTTFDNYQSWQLNGGTSTEAIGKNETVVFSGSGGTTVSNSGNTVTISSVDTNTTNFNVQANSQTATNISAGETVNFTGSGGISVTRTNNSFTIDGATAGITNIVEDITPQLGGQLDANGQTILMGTNTITDVKVGNWDTAYGDKVNTIGFDTATGILTLNRQDGGSITKDLDGRYLTSAPATNITVSQGSTAVGINSSTGTDDSIAAATTSLAGVMTAADKTKLNGIAASATNTAAPAITTNGSTPSLAGGITAAEVRSLIGAGTGNGTATINDTGVPAILSNGSTPSLNGGISAAEIRSLIGAGTGNGTLTSESDTLATVTGRGATTTAAVQVGSLTATGNVTAFSDERLKDNVETLEGSKVYEMRGVSFTKDGKASSGVIAQEIQKVAPELVEDGGEYLSVAYGNLVGYLIEAVKDLKAEVDALKEKN